MEAITYMEKLTIHPRSQAFAEGGHRVNFPHLFNLLIFMYLKPNHACSRNFGKK